MHLQISDCRGWKLGFNFCFTPLHSRMSREDKVRIVASEGNLERSFGNNLLLAHSAFSSQDFPSNKQHGLDTH